MSNAVLWQHVVCVLGVYCVVCLLGAVQRETVQHAVHTPQPKTHAATTLHYL